MKKLLFFPIICLVTTLFSACDNDNRYGDASNDGYLKLNFHQAETRADITPDGSGTFTEGDIIGLYIDNGNDVEYRTLQYTDGEWLPRLRRSEFGDGTLTLAAHYPAIDVSASGVPENYPLQLACDQTETLPDMLFSTTTMKTGEYSADMQFTHALHRIDITLSGTTDGVVIAVRSKTTGVMNLLTGAVSITDGDFQWITPHEISDGSYEAIVIPQPAEPYREGDGLVRLTTQEKEKFFMAPQELSDGKPLTEFEAGKKIDIALNIKGEQPSYANKTVWVYGVNVPDFPGDENIQSVPYPPVSGQKYPEGEWFRYDISYSEEQYLTWKEGCGWYDCNKSPKYDEDDGQLCWAAAASDHVIWWLVNNQKYIEAYDKDYGSSVSSTVNDDVFERPSSEFMPLLYNGTVNRAPVFEFFKQSFPNRGSWSAAGVNWFVTGNTKNLQSPDIKGFPGFFSQIFSKSDVISYDAPRLPNKEVFNQFIIKALQSNQAISFSVNDVAGSGSGNHAMAIWGVEFDSEGYISYIYYCDNNNADQDPNGAAIMRKQIVYEIDDSIPELGPTEYTFLKMLDSKDGTTGGKFKIIALSATDLRQDIWAQKYPSITAE